MEYINHSGATFFPSLKRPSLPHVRVLLASAQSLQSLA
jgi:hypothetical protein